MKDDLASAAACELASLYSLGALDELESARFEEHLLEGCPGCDADLAADRSVMSLLGFSAEPADPPPGLRARLLAEAAESVPSAGPDLASVGDWQPHSIAGVATRTLNLDMASRTITLLVRAEAGARYPTHRHASVEEMFMIYGDLTLGETRYGVGDYIRSEAGSTHSAGSTAHGCMFLIRTSIDDEMLPDLFAGEHPVPVPIQ
jgi:anti-sigma factor ChrR (cupin superfamily)